MENYKHLDTGAKIRLAIFALIMLWGVYLSVDFARIIYDIRFGDRLINVTEINNLDTGSKLLTGFASFCARSVNVSVSFFLVLIYAGLILLFTMIPMYLFRIFALRDDVETTAAEADMGKKIMIAAFIIVMFLGILVTEGSTFLPLLLFSLMWYSSGFLCYITQIKGQTLD